MKKKNRVRRNEDFQRIIAKKKSVANGTFVVYYQPNSLDYLRIGISVGRKLGNAVERNKVKRQLRMMLSESCDLRASEDIIVIVRKKFASQSYAENKKDLLALLKKVKMDKYGILNCKENLFDESIS